MNPKVEVKVLKVVDHGSQSDVTVEATFDGKPVGTHTWRFNCPGSKAEAAAQAFAQTHITSASVSAAPDKK